MVGDEKERVPHAADSDNEPDVEAHRRRLQADDAPAEKADDDDTPDVEAHRRKL
jgi:hypothetical protein